MSPASPTARAALTSLLLWVAASCALWSLSGLVTPGSWRTTGLVALALTSIVMTTTRIVLTRLGVDGLVATLAPSASGLLTSAWFLAARFGADGEFHLVPGVDEIWLTVELARSAPAAAATSVAPADPSAPLALLAVGGALAVLVLSDILAALRTPLLAGVPLVLLWLPSLLITADIPTGPLVGSCLAVLLLATVDNPHSPTRGSAQASPLGRRAVGLESAATLGAVAALVVGASLVALVAPSTVLWATTGAPDIRRGGAAVRVSDVLDVRESLGARANNVVFRYWVTPLSVTEGERVRTGPFKTRSLYTFDGQTWSPDDSQSSRTTDFWPQLAPATTGQYDVRIQAEGLRDQLLPAPVDPRTASASLLYDDDADAIYGDRALARGDEYTLTVRQRDLAPETIAAGWTEMWPDAAWGGALDLPVTSHMSDVQRVASEVTADAGSPYEIALALQNYLRDTSRFAYSLDVPEPVTDDAVWDFLNDRSGYCVQFATAMTIMARSVGLPTRMSVGFLEGDVSRDGEGVVRGKDAHAWPEVYLGDVGWVRFEPTPSVQTGPAPSYAPTPTASAPAETTAPDPTAERTDPRPTTARPTTTGTATVVAEGDGPSPVLLGGAVLAALLLVAGGVVARRVVRARAAHDVEAAWRAVCAEAVRTGTPLPDGATSRTAADLIEPDDDGAVHRLARLVEDERYAPSAGARERPELGALVDEALAGIRSRAAAARRA